MLCGLRLLLAVDGGHVGDVDLDEVAASRSVAHYRGLEIVTENKLEGTNIESMPRRRASDLLLVDAAGQNVWCSTYALDITNSSSAEFQSALSYKLPRRRQRLGF